MEMGTATMLFAWVNIIIYIAIFAVSAIAMVLSIRFLLLGIKALRIYLAKEQAGNHGEQD